MKTIGSIILGNMEDLIANGVIPQYKCKICRTEFVFRRGDFCDFCIDDIVNDEGE